MIQLIPIILLGALAATSSVCAVADNKPEAQTWLHQVESTTDAFLEQWGKESFANSTHKVTFKKNNLDRMTRMPVCEVPLDTKIINLSKSYQQLTLTLACDMPRWKINRPIQLSILAPVITAKTALPRGTVLTKDHLKSQEVDITRVHRGYYTDKKNLIGATTTRPFNMGHLINPSQVKPPFLVRKQQQVVVSAKSKTLSVNVKGIALEDGFMGDIISIRNPQSKRTIEARVTGLGKVLVAL